MPCRFKQQKTFQIIKSENQALFKDIGILYNSTKNLNAPL